MFTHAELLTIQAALFVATNTSPVPTKWRDYIELGDKVSQQLSSPVPSDEEHEAEMAEPIRIPSFCDGCGHSHDGPRCEEAAPCVHCGGDDCNFDGCALSPSVLGDSGAKQLGDSVAQNCTCEYCQAGGACRGQ